MYLKLNKYRILISWRLPFIRVRVDQNHDLNKLLRATVNQLKPISLRECFMWGAKNDPWNWIYIATMLFWWIVEFKKGFSFDDFLVAFLISIPWLYFWVVNSIKVGKSNKYHILKERFNTMPEIYFDCDKCKKYLSLKKSKPKTKNHTFAAFTVLRCSIIIMTLTDLMFVYHQCQVAPRLKRENKMKKTWAVKRYLVEHFEVEAESREEAIKEAENMEDPGQVDVIKETFKIQKEKI